MIDSLDPALVEATRRSEEIAPVVDFRTLVDEPIADLRAAFDAGWAYWNANPPPLASVSDHAPDGPHGKVPMRCYLPAEGPLPAVLYFHGGGFSLGNIESHDTTCRQLALEAGAAVVSVDYRLAPEHRFPVALEECLFACDWLAGQGGGLGVDTGRLAVGGDSAGANLALAVLNARREALAAAVLFYGCYGHLPEYGFPLGASGEAFGDGKYGLGLRLMRRFYDDYLRDEADGRDPRFCSLREDFRGLPPVLLAAARLDPLRDDSEALRARLEEAGVAHRHVDYPGMPHGFLRYCLEVDTAKRALADAGAFLQERWRD